MSSQPFTRQHVLLKLFFVLILISLSTIYTTTQLLIALVSFLIFLCLEPKILQRWLMAILKILPFFTSLFLIGLIFQMPFMQQLILSIKIIYILLLSVFLIISTPAHTLMADTIKWQSRNWTRDLRFFLLTTMQFIPHFKKAYQTSISNKRFSFTHLHNALHLCMQSIHEVETEGNTNVEITSRKIDWKANSLLILILIINFILLLG